MAAKLAEFGHLVVEGYRQSRYVPAAALVRSLFEEVTMLAWVAAPDDPEAQRRRATRVALDQFRRARHRKQTLPPDAEKLLKHTTGRAAKKPPSSKAASRR